MKRILVTDTHLGVKKANDHYLELVSQLFDDIGVYADEHSIKEMIHLGDFFDNRKNMSLKTLHYARRIGMNLRQHFNTTHMILGNHDIFYKDRYLPNSHQVFGSMEHINVIDEPTQVGNCLLVPWIVEGGFFGEEHIAGFRQTIQDSPAEFCLGHWEMNGAAMNQSGQVVTGGEWDTNMFSKFRKTFSGHFHTRGEYPNNVQYLGSPYHMTFNDAGPRGFYVFDDTTGDLEFIEWNGYPKFIQWVARPDDLIVEGDFTGQVVKIIFGQDFGTTINNQIIQDIQNTNPHQLFTEYKFTHMMTDDKVTDDIQLMGPTEIHLDFINNAELPQHIKKSVLGKIVTQLYEEIS